MNNLTLSSIAAAALMLSVTVEARPSTEAEFRGYTHCVNYADERSNGLVAEREYLLNRAGDVSQYYVNATRWEAGERNAIRVACETSRYGRKLISASIADGRYTSSKARVTVEVAQN